MYVTFGERMQHPEPLTGHENARWRGLQPCNAPGTMLASLPCVSDASPSSRGGFRGLRKAVRQGARLHRRQHVDHSWWERDGITTSSARCQAEATRIGRAAGRSNPFVQRNIRTAGRGSWGIRPRALVRMCPEMASPSARRDVGRTAWAVPVAGLNSNGVRGRYTVQGLRGHLRPGEGHAGCVSPPRREHPCRRPRTGRARSRRR
jgi:hypothetical protein